MENTQSNQAQSPSSAKIGFLVVGFLALAALGVLAYEKRPQSSVPSEQVSGEEQIPSVNTGAGLQEETSVMVEGESQYADGEYSVMGEYTSPGGPEQIEVSVTLENDIIVDAEVVPQATLPISVKMQEAFTSGYEEFVIGKDIDEVELTKVAGSSLTPKGFNDALEKIKQESLS